MYLFLSFLEDSGYVVRAAFIMNRLMQELRLPCKSFVPLIVGFGQDGVRVVFSLYMPGILIAILTGLVLKYTLIRAAAALFRHGVAGLPRTAPEKPAAANLAKVERLRATR